LDLILAESHATLLPWLQFSLNLQRCKRCNVVCVASVANLQLALMCRYFMHETK